MQNCKLKLPSTFFLINQESYLSSELIWIAVKSIYTSLYTVLIFIFIQIYTNIYIFICIYSIYTSIYTYCIFLEHIHRTSKQKCELKFIKQLKFALEEWRQLSHFIFAFNCL